MTSKTTTCGIDFGTSNSAVCLAKENATEMVRLEGENTNIPSAIFFDTDENTVIYGQNGIDAFTLGQEGRLMRALKSILGTDLIHEKTQIGMRRVSFEDILTQFITHLKEKAEAQAVQEIRSVVMGRPVHFVDNDSDADKQAQNKLQQVAHQAGFTNVQFQFEPIAAALAYEASTTKEELALIADIGGGTSDFSVIKVGPSSGKSSRKKETRQQDILANTGVRMGGTNLDTHLSVSGVMPHLGMESETVDKLSGGKKSPLPQSLFLDLATWHKIHLLYTHKYERFARQLAREVDDNGEFNRYLEIIQAQKGHMLAGLVEAAKISLSHKEQTTLKLCDIFNQEKFAVPLDKKTFEQSIHEEMLKIKGAVNLCLKQAGVKKNDITAIFLTGGSTAVPLVKAAICEDLPAGTIISGDKFNSVGRGLGIEAGIVFK